jgi:hypothetical protein
MSNCWDWETLNTRSEYVSGVEHPEMHTIANRTNTNVMPNLLMFINLYVHYINGAPLRRGSLPY